MVSVYNLLAAIRCASVHDVCPLLLAVAQPSLLAQSAMRSQSTTHDDGMVGEWGELDWLMWREPKLLVIVAVEMAYHSG